MLARQLRRLSHRSRGASEDRSMLDRSSKTISCRDTSSVDRTLDVSACRIELPTTRFASQADTVSRESTLATPSMSGLSAEDVIIMARIAHAHIFGRRISPISDRDFARGNDVATFEGRQTELAKSARAWLQTTCFAGDIINGYDTRIPNQLHPFERQSASRGFRTSYSGSSCALSPSARRGCPALRPPRRRKRSIRRCLCRWRHPNEDHAEQQQREQHPDRRQVHRFVSCWSRERAEYVVVTNTCNGTLTADPNGLSAALVNGTIAASIAAK